MFEELPANWRLVTLGAVTKLVQYGLTAKSSENTKGYRYLRITDIDDDGRISDASPKFVDVDDDTLEKYQLQANDLVIARSGSVGRAFLYKISDKPWIFASYLIRFRPNPELIDADFLDLYTKSPFYWHYIDSKARSVAQPNINSKELSRLPIPLPPLPEQRRIVEILRQAEALRTLRRQADEASASILQSLFEFARSNAIRWERLGTFVGEVEKVNPNQTDNDTFVYVDISSINNQDGRITNYVELPSSEAPSRARQRIFRNDVLVSTVRPNLRNTAIVIKDVGDKLLIASTGFAVLRANAPEVSPYYLYLISRSDWFTQVLTRKAQGGGYPAVLERDVRNVKIPIVGQSDLSKIDASIATFLRIRENSLSTTAYLNELRDALLAYAFTGELTAAWREAHAEALRAAAAERDRILGIRSKAVAAVRPKAAAERPSFTFDETHPRYEVLKALSAEQLRLFDYLQQAETYLTPEALAEAGGVSTHQARRALEIFVSLGLAVPVSVPLSPTGQGTVWVDAYRPLTAADDARTDDLAVLNRKKNLA